MKRWKKSILIKIINFFGFLNLAGNNNPLELFYIEIYWKGMRIKIKNLI